jgi:hypothetical protein
VVVEIRIKYPGGPACNHGCLHLIGQLQLFSRFAPEAAIVRSMDFNPRSEMATRIRQWFQTPAGSRELHVRM